MSPTKSKNPLADLSTSLADAVEQAGGYIVAIHARRRIPSSGVLWRDGVIVSASHTVRADGDVAVTLPSGDAARATVVGRDAATDLIALRLNDATAKAATRADADASRVGSLVLAVGRPGRRTSASFGIISAVADDWRGTTGGRIDRVLRLDLSIYDGFSGGPLVDATGGVIGIDNSALARGTPVALPAATVDRVVDELLERGHVRRPFIGVAVQQVALNATTVARHKLSRDGGLVVVSIADGSPAESAGILIGDVLIAADGQPLRRPTDLLDALTTIADGVSIELEHLRGSAVVKSSVTPTDRGARDQ
jgi:S1-C subfamily serine protease